MRGRRPSGARAAAHRLRPAAARRPRAGGAPAAAQRAEVERLRALTSFPEKFAPKGVRSDTIAAMRLFALRGAISVERNDAQESSRPPTRADAGDHGSATALAPETSSAASSPPPTTSTPSSPPSPRARSASSACRCCARGRSPCPARMPRVIRVLIHYHADRGPRARARLPGRGARAARRPARGAVASGAQRRPGRNATMCRGDRVLRAHQAHPVYPAAGGYAQEAPLVRLASNESPFPPLTGGARGDRARARRRSTATPTRPTRCCAQRLSDRYGVPALADRDRQRLLRHPARRRRGAARARRRARLRVALLLGLPAPGGRLRRARDHRPARRRTSATTCRRCCARSPSPRGW